MSIIDISSKYYNLDEKIRRELKNLLNVYSFDLSIPYKKEEIINSGILYCSGMIAGEGLVGILMAVLAIIPVGGTTLAGVIDISGRLALPDWLSKILSLVIFGLVVLSLLKFTVFKSRKKKRTILYL